MDENFDVFVNEGRIADGLFSVDEVGGDVEFGFVRSVGVVSEEVVGLGAREFGGVFGGVVIFVGGVVVGGLEVGGVFYS